MFDWMFTGAIPTHYQALGTLGMFMVAIPMALIVLDMFNIVERLKKRWQVFRNFKLITWEPRAPNEKSECYYCRDPVCGWYRITQMASWYPQITRWRERPQLELEPTPLCYACALSFAEGTVNVGD